MLCFARGLGFADDCFVKAHDVSRPDSQTTLRLLHYFAVDKSVRVPEGYFRAGAHADWGFLTLLFQRPGQSGLEICPGREVVSDFGIGDEWTKVDFEAGDIVCNIGDLLMSWSGDRFKSTFHRARAHRSRDGLLRTEIQYCVLQPTLWQLHNPRAIKEIPCRDRRGVYA